MMSRTFLIKDLSESDVYHDEEKDIIIDQSMTLHSIPNINIGFTKNEMNVKEEEYRERYNNSFIYLKTIEDLHQEINSMTTDCLRLPPLSGLYLPEKYHLLQQSLFANTSKLCSTTTSIELDDEEGVEYIIPSPIGYTSPSPVGFHMSVIKHGPYRKKEKSENSLQVLSVKNQQHCVIFPEQIGNQNQHVIEKTNSFYFYSHSEHLENIETTKEYKCDVCLKSFKRAGSLSNHKLIHKSTKSFKCECCKMSFLRKSDLGKHMVIHSGNKPYQCDTCGKRFSQSSNMLTHHRRHSGVRPYSCNLCGKSFYRKVDVRRHNSVHRD